MATEWQRQCFLSQLPSRFLFPLHHMIDKKKDQPKPGKFIRVKKGVCIFLQYFLYDAVMAWLLASNDYGL